VDEHQRTIASEERVIFALVVFAGMPRLVGGLVRGERDFGVALCLMLVCIGLIGLSRRCPPGLPRAVASRRAKSR
jgi:hypothetical protein